MQKQQNSVLSITIISCEYKPALKGSRPEHIQYGWSQCVVSLCFSLDISHLCILYFSLCPWIILSISLSLNIFSQFSLAALMLVCITVQHWLELSALTEQHLSCWSVEYLYNSPLYWHEASWNKDGAKRNRVQNMEKQDKNKIWKREQVRNRRGKWKEQVRERLQRRGWGKERRGGGKDKMGERKDRERESGRAREEAKNAWQGLSILRQMHNVRSTALHRTVSCLLFSSYLF